MAVPPLAWFRMPAAGVATIRTPGHLVLSVISPGQKGHQPHKTTRMSSPRRPHRLHERQQTTKTNDTVATYQYVYIYHDRYKHTVSIRRARLAVAKRDSAKIKNFSVKFRKRKHAAETRKVDWKSQSNRWITLSSLFSTAGIHPIHLRRFDGMG